MDKYLKIISERGLTSQQICGIIYTYKRERTVNQLTKNETIRESIRETKNRREGMVCRVFEVKIKNGKLSNKAKTHLNNLFTEAKWVRNAHQAPNRDQALRMRILRVLSPVEGPKERNEHTKGSAAGNIISDKKNVCTEHTAKSPV
jgi:hypothetical protein